VSYFALCGDVYHDSVGIAHYEDFDMLIVDLFCGLFCFYYGCCGFHCDVGESTGTMLRGHAL
jgi:hypothetical protein